MGRAGRNRWRSPGTLRLAVVAAVGVLAGTSAAVAGGELASRVTWTTTTESGTALFQGKVSGSVVEGRLYAGGGQLVVKGTVAPDGTVSGTLSAPDGTELGTFSSVLQSGEVVGSYALQGGGGGVWSAPALPRAAP